MVSHVMGSFQVAPTDLISGAHRLSKEINDQDFFNELNTAEVMAIVADITSKDRLFLRSLKE